MFPEIFFLYLYAFLHLLCYFFNSTISLCAYLEKKKITIIFHCPVKTGQCSSVDCYYHIIIYYIISIFLPKL